MMKSKHIKTFKEIYDSPVRSSISWKDIEGMLAALGVEISEGNGSRVRLAYNGVRATFHRPHPKKATDKGAVVSMRCF